MNKTLFKVSPENISPNPYNPRIIFDEESMNELKKSINKVGILVPLTVYRNTKNYPNTEFVLLDGERRWRCSKELNLESIPVNVIDEPADVTQNILYMFNIHHYRKEWELFPTALKLEKIIEELGTDSEKTLNEFTGVSRSTIRRCKMLLWLPNKYRDVLIKKNSKVSTDFFIELYPIAYRLSQEEEYYQGNKLEEFIDDMINIFTEGTVITDVKEFREIRKVMGYHEKNKTFDEFKIKINQFIHSKDPSLDVFIEDDVENDRSRRNMLKYISFLNKELKDINSDLMSDYTFIDQLETLKHNIEEALEKLD
ncbi:ParB/RepB/Spo0J family partition protein [uncultured Clostridium sp.]|uniref:ParB/RepB/Spo0J family partition protein n=1 Tax=uncultured Clostridium sp. TaxID=59620 RepID=UPI0025CE3F87|nr:ParB/RepB/Spo0J family partition protein [uncultured Clostridium sp.]